MDYKKLALEKHAEWKGKIEVVSRVALSTRKDLSVAYTPGVAEPCLEIAKDANKSFEYTRRANLVAVVTDGSAVLGLGNIGGLAGMPVMEGKCALFKSFADVDAFPICLNTQDTDEIIETVKNIAPSFGGINLEDIAAPRCFEIEEKLIEALDIPVFHDDQHGTAVVTLAALINAARLKNCQLQDFKVCVSGPGAAGSAITRLLLECGVKDIVMCDRKGTLYEGREGMDFSKTRLAAVTNRGMLKGNLSDAIDGADVFIGVSGAGLVSPQMVSSMNKNPIVFAMANPIPEIFPDEALKAGAMIVGSGRSDFCNQINNVLAFPGIFRGALDCRAKKITGKMKIAAAYALADFIPSKQLKADYIIPSPLDKAVAAAVAKAVKNAALEA